MKRVGIVTLIGNVNYGNRLQNYATQNVLKKLGVDTITIRNAYGLNSKTSKLKYIKKIGGYIYNSTKFYLFKCNYKRLNRFKQFDKNIKFTSRLNTIYNVNKNNCDYYIVGSDQVWKPTYGRLSDLDLLTFVDGSKRIAYAASFGISFLPREHQERAKKEFLKFKAISVREETGKEIVMNLTDRQDVELLIDPTMMLDVKDWDKVSIRPRQLDNLKNEKYILNYFLGNISESTKEIINKFAEENNCHVINLLDKKDPFYETGPSEFLYLEKHAFLICTDSFHSSAFSILFDRPFIVFDRNDKRDNMNSRNDTLLSKFKLEDRKFNGTITDHVLEHDYSKAYKILDEERAKSNTFLRKALDIDS